MEELDLKSGVKFVVKENVLAVVSKDAFRTVSSAIYNGGTKQVKAVLNVGVPEGYSDQSLHLDPFSLITSSAAKIGVAEDYLAMVTAAKIQNYSLVIKKTSDFSVSVVATAGCSHGESSGEEMNVQEMMGTINIIVLIDGNPSDSAMVASLITATEAKSATLRDFDVRSRYTGDSATGSITDSVTIASTGTGKPLILAGPASRLGKIVGHCTRQAVAEALLQQEPVWANRSVFDRLKERHLPIEKLSNEVSKIKGLEVSADKLTELLKKNPSTLASLMAAAKMDDDYKKNLLPTDFKDWREVTAYIGAPKGHHKLEGYESVELPPFVKDTLIEILKAS